MNGSDSYNVLTVGTTFIPMGGADLMEVNEYRLNSSFHLFSAVVILCVIIIWCRVTQ